MAYPQLRSRPYGVRATTPYQRRRRALISRGRAIMRRPANIMFGGGMAGYAARALALGAVRRVGAIRKRQLPNFDTTPRMKLRKAEVANNSRKKIVGFNIVRQKLMNQGFQDTNASFDNCKGIGPILQSQYYNILFSNSTTIDPTTTIVPGNISNWRPMILCPQWPGSELSAFDSVLCGASSNVIPRFGVIVNNTQAASQTQQPGNNYQFNLNVIKNMYSYLTDNTELSSNQIDYTGNSIRVYNSFLTFRFTNPATTRKDVHIFKFRFKDYKFENGNGTCEEIDNMKVEKILNNLSAMQQQSPTADKSDENAATTSLLNLIRKGKLPDKLFKVYKHKKVTLGGNPGYNEYSEFYKITHCKTVKMRFGSTVFKRSTCSNHYEVFTNEMLTNRRQNLMHVMVICLPHYDNLAAATTSTSEQTEGICYEVTKTNVFKVTEN